MPVTATEDLQYLRVASQIFIRSTQNIYKPLHLKGSQSYIEDLTHRGQYLAISRRNLITKKDLYEPLIEDQNVIHEDYAEYLASKFEGFIRSKSESAKISTDTTLLSDRSSDNPSSSQTSLGDVGQKLDDQLDSRRHSEADVELSVEEASSVSSEDLDSRSLAADSDFNSAEMSWSECSTQASSELDDDDDWNDWEEKHQLLEDISDSEDFMTSASDLDIESNPDIASPHEDIEIWGASMRLRPFRNSEEESIQSEYDESTGVQSMYSNSDYSGSDDGSSENEDAARLEDLLLGHHDTSSRKAQNITLQVYDTSAESQHLSPIFHFTHKTVGSLYNSAPVFHPTKPLLVWPLGENEILFADISMNTYFTRLLSCTTYSSCHVFVKAHFSPEGDYLHFAALEASHVDAARDRKLDNENIRLNLQVTTHRLSQHKTTRAPPRVVFRTNISLGKTARLNVSNLPYSLTWRSKEVYLTTRDTKLNIIRIPLFAPGPTTDAVPVCHTQKPVYLPRTALSRSVRFFPPPEGEAAKDRKSKRGKATVILGSHSSMPAQGVIVPKIQVSPPIGVYLDVERDLGGWKTKPHAESNGEKVKANRVAGRLQGRFEAFDLKEDCDIVPYLF